MMQNCSRNQVKLINKITVRPARKRKSERFCNGEEDIMP